MPQTQQLGPYPQTQADGTTINLGLGQPCPRLLPLDLLREAAAHALGPSADPLVLQYGIIAGYSGFREALAQLLSRRYEAPVAADQLVVTGGISSALSMVAEVFAPPGRPVVCSDPTYFLARGIFESQGLTTVGIAVDEHGLDVDALAQRLAEGLRPSLLYCMPSFHNPCGVELSAARARRLVELAQRYDFVIAADEPYVMLHSGPTPPASLTRFDEGRGRVLSLGSFSKILGPGLRLGWVHGEPELLDRFCAHGALCSGGGLNPLVSALVHRVIETGALDQHIDRLRAELTTRRSALVEALREHLPGVDVPSPAGGYFVWLRLPASIDTVELWEHATTAHAVGFTPGTRCAVDRDLSHHLRVCFAFYEPDELREGARRLAAAIDSYEGRLPPGPASK